MMYKIDMSLVIRMKHCLQSSVDSRTLTIKESAKHREVLSHEKLDKFVDLYVTKVKKVSLDSRLFKVLFFLQNHNKVPFS